MHNHLNREQLEAFLQEHDIPFDALDHDPIFTVEQGRAFEARQPGAHTKNLFLKDKKGQLWLISAHAETRVDLKGLPPVIGSARLSFGKPDLMQTVLGVTPGSVTAFALVNDRDARVKFILDKAILDHTHVNFHPLRNDATTNMKTADLLRFLDLVGHQPMVVDFQTMAQAPLA